MGQKRTQCNRCIMDTTDPEIIFDKEGICNHCRHYEEQEATRKVEELCLSDIVAHIKKSKTKYDCLIGLSGGVDSSLCLHYIKELGLKPLAFSLDNGWNTKEADENVLRMVEKLGIPHKKVVLNMKQFGELQKAFMRANVKNVEIPTDHVLWATTYKLARENGIKYVISGGNLATESIMPKSWGYNATDYKLIKTIAKRFSDVDLKTLPTMKLWGYIYSRFVKGIKIIELLDYFDYNREKAIELLKEKYDYQPYGDKHGESLFTKWFQEEYLPRKFGIDKRKAHYSSLINSGQMTKEEAQKRMKEPIGFKIKVFENLFTHYDVKDEKYYPNSSFWWNLLGKIYACIK